MKNENIESEVKKFFKNKEESSVQDWLPIEKIFDNGVVKCRDGKFIKIMKITPINFNLKTELEKEAILNSYKIFLKTCNFDLQILIQSNKEDLSEHISSVKNFTKKENNNIKKISEEYINFLEELNLKRKSATKNYYIIIKKEKKLIEKNNIENSKNIENTIFDELNENFLKIKDTLSRCGNLVINIDNKNTCKNILFSFFYPKNTLNQEG